MAEIALSQLALRRATSNEVKQYAQRMIRDHSQANARLTQLARQKRVTLPTQLDAKHQAIRAQLEQLSGERFDQEYMMAMENDHALATALFQNGARQAQDRDVKAFASTTLPKVQGHLQMVRTMTGNSSPQNQNSGQR
jgi:putative membrane protein